MTRPVYTSLLMDGDLVAPATLGSGPWPGFRVVVKDVTIQDIAGDSSYASLFGAEDDGIITGYGSVPEGFYFFWHGTQALVDGDTLVGVSDGSNVTFRVSGYLLSL
jgi:hypothetical protein